MPVGCCVFYKIVCKKGNKLTFPPPKIIYYIAYCCDRQKKSLGQSLEIKGGIFSSCISTSKPGSLIQFYDLETSLAKERKPG